MPLGEARKGTRRRILRTEEAEVVGFGRVNRLSKKLSGKCTLSLPRFVP